MITDRRGGDDRQGAGPTVGSALPTVLEVGTGVAAGYCGRLLGAMGFDVVRLEDPDAPLGPSGGPMITAADGESRNALAEYLGCFKDSVVAPEDSAGGAAARALLLDGAEIVIDDHEGDPAAALQRSEALRERNPALVHIVLSPFGLTGPYASYRANEFIDLAMSGHLYITGYQQSEPLQAGGPWSGYVAGTIAAISALAAAHRARRTGRGALIDIGRMEAMAGVHQWSLLLYTYQGYVKRRWGNRMAESTYPFSFFQCADGWVCIGVGSIQRQWEGLCIAFDIPELLFDERYTSGGDRFDHADELDAIIVPKIEKMTVAETIDLMQAHRVPAGPVLSALETLLDEQLDERSFWAALDHIGPGAKVPERPFHFRGEPPFRPAPERGHDTEAVLLRWGASRSNVRDALHRDARGGLQHVP